MKLKANSVPMRTFTRGNGVAATAPSRASFHKARSSQRRVAVNLNPQIIYVNATAPELQHSVKISEEYRSVHGTDGDLVFEEA
ncbi:hypothetical protein AAGQ96_06560 [Pantoea sp. MBD-2R]|uniref:hypothetical protein n=1 Tax=unclassified Pantoea TaxID=2630326 RepID=UPI0011BD5425|nr:hypothetical protein [Pantoea sp. CCBC3-3-1]